MCTNKTYYFIFCDVLKKFNFVIFDIIIIIFTSFIIVFISFVFIKPINYLYNKKITIIITNIEKYELLI